MKERLLCPNCGAHALTLTDHDTGRPSPDKWACDRLGAMDERPNYLLTYQAAKAVQAVLINSGQLQLAAMFND